MISNCYVYLITESYSDRLKGFCAVKIGLAVDPNRRIRELQTGNARRLELLMTIGPMSEKQAADTERKLHKRFERYRLVGEWFTPKAFRELRDKPKFLPEDLDIKLFKISSGWRGRKNAVNNRKRADEMRRFEMEAVADAKAAGL